MIAGSKKPKVVKLDIVVNWLIAASKIDIVINWLIAASRKPKFVKIDIVVNWLIAASKKPEVVKLDIVADDRSQQEAWGCEVGYRG